MRFRSSGQPLQFRPSAANEAWILSRWKRGTFPQVFITFLAFFASSSALCMLDSSSAKRISFIFHAGALFYKFCTLGWFVEQGLFCGTAFQTKPLQMDITSQKRAFSWVFSENFSPFVLPIVLRFGYLYTYFLENGPCLPLANATATERLFRSPTGVPTTTNKYQNVKHLSSAIN